MNELTATQVIASEREWRRTHLPIVARAFANVQAHFLLPLLFRVQMKIAAMRIGPPITTLQSTLEIPR